MPAGPNGYTWSLAEGCARHLEDHPAVATTAISREDFLFDPAAMTTDISVGANQLQRNRRVITPTWTDRHAHPLIRTRAQRDPWSARSRSMTGPMVCVPDAPPAAPEREEFPLGVNSELLKDGAEMIPHRALTQIEVSSDGRHALSLKET